MPVRIFLSHSSHAPLNDRPSAAATPADAVAEAAALQLVVDVAKCLEDMKYTVLLDKERIQNGQRWRQYIHEALADCDAAVIFLSDWSIASSWVRVEATVLTERQWRDPGFKLLPILLPGTDKSKLEKGDWSPLQLREIQTPNAGDVNGIVNAIAAFVGPPAPAVSRLDRLREDIGLLLQDIDAKILQQACVDFGIDVKWQIHADRSRALADIISRKVLRDESSGVAEAVKILKALVPHLRQAPGKIIVGALEPLWVSQAVSSALELAATKRLPTFRDVALNGWKIADFTAEQYLLRARPNRTDWELAQVVDTAPPERVEHVKQELRRWLRTTFPDYHNAKPDKIDRQINSLDGLFILLPFVPDADEMLALRAAYDTATFVCSINGRPAYPIDLPDGVVFLEPALESEEVEENALSEVSKARRFVEKLLR